MLVALIEPHTYGTSQKGQTALRAYQTGGTSQSGGIPDWRIFYEARITALAVSERTFAAKRPGYVPNDPFFATIRAQL